MKSIKPGRGPSRQSMVGAIAVALFGVFWTIGAVSIGGYFMIPFGLIFIGVAIYQAVYAYKNTTSKDRYSIVDIVDDDEESDPLNDKYGRKNGLAKSLMETMVNDSSVGNGTSVNFCPFCGNEVDKKFDFCPKCGQKLPD